MKCDKPTDLDAALATMSADGLRGLVHELLRELDERTYARFVGSLIGRAARAGAGGAAGAGGVVPGTVLRDAARAAFRAQEVPPCPEVVGFAHGRGSASPEGRSRRGPPERAVDDGGAHRGGLDAHPQLHRVGE